MLVIDTIRKYGRDTIYFKDKDSKFIWNNYMHANQLGVIKPDELVGKSDFDFFPKDFAEKARQVELDIMRTGKPIINIEEELSFNDDEDVKVNWEKIKLKEGKNKTVLGGVPQSLPALVKAYRIQDKAHGVGFDWNDPELVWDKVKEEMAEFKAEMDKNSAKKEEEFGDLLFALVNYARHLHIHPEDALEKTNRKFIKRFQYIENQAIANGKSIADLSLDEMENLWQEAKSTSIG